MKAIEYSSLKFCEACEIDGIHHIAIVDDIDSEHVRLIPVHDLTDPKQDQPALDFINAMAWPLAGKIDPLFRHDNGINFEDPEAIYEKFTDITTRIARLLESSMYFKDDRYAAVITNFIFNSFFKDVFEFAPRIIVLGSTVSGKSRLQEIMAGLCYRGYWTQRPTFAALKRLMHIYRITPFIDEVQRLKGQARNDLDDIFFAGDQKGRKLTSVNVNNLKVESFNTFGPMLISLKAGGYTHEDQDNRSFILNLIQNRNKKLDPTLNAKEIDNIRTDLYSLYALYKIHPEAFRFEDLLKDSTRQLVERDPKTNRSVSDYHRAKEDEISEIKGRALDIAKTYYTLSRITHTESEILSILTDEQLHNSERLKETTEAGIYNALMSCCADEFRTNTAWGYMDTLERIPTKDITLRYNNDLRESGNSRNIMDEITGNRVTRTLGAMGFDIKRGAGGRSYIKWTKDTEETLDTLEDKFGSDESKAILNDMRKRFSRKS